MEDAAETKEKGPEMNSVKSLVRCRLVDFVLAIGVTMIHDVLLQSISYPDRSQLRSVREV